MSNDETSLQGSPARPTKGGSGKALIEWFWQGRAMAEYVRLRPAPNARAALLAERARSCAEIAESLRVPDEPLGVSAEASASELYRQAIYWALSARAAESGAELALEYSESVWETLDERTLRDALEDEPSFERIRNVLRIGSFVYFAELPAEEQKRLCGELRNVAARAISNLGERSHQLDRINARRAWRLLSLAVTVLVVIVGGVVLQRAILERSDLALGKPWALSSRWNDSGCFSPEQTCTNNKGYFFHTNEETNPWFEIDLGAPRDVSRAVIENRADCCKERAFPLVVEVSSNHKDWKEVARRNSEFDTWRADLDAPRTRWVRFRVLKFTNLHFSRVKIY